MCFAWLTTANVISGCLILQRGKELNLEAYAVGSTTYS